MQGGVEVQRHAFLTSALDGDKWLVAHARFFFLLPLGKVSLVRTGRAPEPVLDFVENRKTYSSSWESNPNLVVQSSHSS
jgi:hypothetical protein